jgi:hypothetical protein
MDELSPGMLKVLKQIAALLDKTVERGCTEEEATAATAKAQELLTKYNLDASLVGQAHGQEGRREEQKIRGGFYEYQQNLWRAVAELNFCLYWCQKAWVKKSKMARDFDGTRYEKTWHQNEKRHRLVGRVVNVRATIAMATYLEGAVERLTRDRLGNDKTQFFSKWAMSYREGMVDRLCEKIAERQRQRMSEERARQAEADKATREAGRDGVSTGTALVLSNYVRDERQANSDWEIDQIHGEGTAARWRAEQQERAEERRRAAAEYTAWAAANPEEAAAKAKADREAREKAEREAPKSRWSGGAGSRGGTSHLKQQDRGAYYAGRDAAANISLDPQVDSGASRKIGRQ